MVYRVDNISDIKKYLKELKKHSQYDLCEYSDSSIYRRVNKVLLDHKLSLDELMHRTRTDPGFVDRIVEEITVNTTEFFRDPEMWKELYTKHFQELKTKRIVNVWHAGCSTGQEVYSDNILLSELGVFEKSRIVATDLSTKVLGVAKKGEYNYRYNKSIKENFNAVFNGGSPDAQVAFDRYFVHSEETDVIRVKDHLKKDITFKRHDLVKGELNSYRKFDVIFCRNVLIYFNASLQARIVKRFHDQLTNGGMLILGNHEGLTGFFKTKFVKNGPVFIKNNAFHFEY